MRIQSVIAVVLLPDQDSRPVQGLKALAMPPLIPQMPFRLSTWTYLLELPRDRVKPKILSRSPKAIAASSRPFSLRASGADQRSRVSEAHGFAALNHEGIEQRTRSRGKSA